MIKYNSKSLEYLSYFLLLLIFLNVIALIVGMSRWSHNFDRASIDLQLSEYEIENLVSSNLKQIEKLEKTSLLLNQLESDQTIVRGIIGEAIGESELGIVAVAWVIRNRMEAGMSLGLCSLNRKNLDIFIARQPQWKKDLVKRVWRDVKNGDLPDPVSGALYFDNVNAFGFPSWIDQVVFIRTIGNHRFYK